MEVTSEFSSCHSLVSAGLGEEVEVKNSLGWGRGGRACLSVRESGVEQMQTDRQTDRCL